MAAKQPLDIQQPMKLHKSYPRRGPWRTEAAALAAGAADYRAGLDPQHQHSDYLDGWSLAACTATIIKSGQQ